MSHMGVLVETSIIIVCNRFQSVASHMSGKTISCMFFNVLSVQDFLHLPPLRLSSTVLYHIITLEMVVVVLLPWRGCYGIITLEGLSWCVTTRPDLGISQKRSFHLPANKFTVSHLLVLCSSGHIHTIFINYLYSNTWIIRSVSAVRIQLSHQCSRMDITSHLCSLILTGKFMWPSTLL